MEKETIMDDFLQNYGIAIIGLSGRFPGANSIQEFWSNLKSGKESISLFTPEELASAGIPESYFTKPNYVPAKGILADIMSFDAEFFNVSPNEAKTMDPQQRIFLESAWQLLEVAGYPTSIANPQSIGVFASTSKNTYLHFNVLSDLSQLTQSEAMQLLLSNEKDYLSTRISYKLNLTGPSMSIQTACSSSLVAVHMACMSLLLEECEMAIAGGVSIDVPQKSGYEYLQGHILSPDGHCRVFDQRAKGTVFSQGVGLVLLKPLKHAIRDHDHIHAVIRGSAVNNDGATKSGFTAQSIERQVDVIQKAIQLSGLKPEDISYVEAHGSSTTLGDPIEVEALRRVFYSGGDAKKSCALGSVKSNLGHLNAASGITGLIKATLVVENKIIPPCINFDSPNPNINFENSPFYINKNLETLTVAHPKAGVSSFGFGGTNAHVVLQGFFEEEREEPELDYFLLNISARSPASLQEYARDIGRFIKDKKYLALSDISFTLQNCRSSFSYRLAFVCSNKSEAIKIITETQFINKYSVTPQKSPPLYLYIPEPGIIDLDKYDEFFKKSRALQKEIKYLMELCISIPSLNNYIIKNIDKETLKLNSEGIAGKKFLLLAALTIMWKKLVGKIDGIVGAGYSELIAAFASGSIKFEDALLAYINSQSLKIEKIPEIQFYSNSTNNWISTNRNLDNTENHPIVDGGTNTEISRFLASLSPGIVLDTSIDTSTYNPLVSLPQKTIASDEILSDDYNQRMLEIAAQLWLHGYNLDWQLLSNQPFNKKVPLPTSPFLRRKYWIDKPGRSFGEVNSLNFIEDDHFSFYKTEHESYEILTNLRKEIEKFILNEFRSILGHHQINVQDNFFSLGGDSLLSIKLINNIQRHYNLELDLNTIYRFPSVEMMTEFILQLHHFPVKDQLIYPKKEERKDILLKPLLEIKNNFRFKENPDNVLVTGASGFLGSYIIKYLLESTGANIYCLIRAANEENAKDKFFSNYYYYHKTLTEIQSQRIKIIPGDISAKDLGLPHDLSESLEYLIDSIYHVAARLSFVEPYEMIKKVNVEGTQNLITFAAQGRTKYLHFISSIAVYNSTTFRDEVVIKENHTLQESYGFYRGYDESKWASEMLLEKAKDFGLPVTIYRPGNIIGDTSTGLLPVHSLISRFFKGCLSLGCVPYSELFLDLEPVDFVAKALVYLSLQKENINKRFHLVNEHPIKWLKLIDIIQSAGYGLQVITFETWKKKLILQIESDPSNPLIPLIPAFTKGPLLSGRVYDCSNTLSQLADSGIQCPVIDAGFVKSFIKSNLNNETNNS